MIDPGTAILIASAVSSAAKGAGEYLTGKKSVKAGKKKAKEAKRETKAGLLDSALQRSAELQAHRLASKQKLGKRKTQSMQESTELVRRALNI